MRLHCHRLPTAALLLALALSVPTVASATGEDFVNETLVAKGLGGRELGFELGSDSRIDRDYRLQGWFTPELEIGVTRAWVSHDVVREPRTRARAGGLARRVALRAARAAALAPVARGGVRPTPARLGDTACASASTAAAAVSV